MCWLEDNAEVIANRIWIQMADDGCDEDATIKVRDNGDVVVFRFEISTEGKSGHNEVAVHKGRPIAMSEDVDIVCDLIITVAKAQVQVARKYET